MRRPDPVYLHDFRLHLPAYRGAHEQVVQWLAAAHTGAETALRKDDPAFDPAAFRRQMERHLRRFAPSPLTVGWRYSDVDEFLDEDFTRKRLFPVAQAPQGAGIGERMEVFAEKADRALAALYASPGEDAPDEMLHVTCTGYSAPSAPQKLMEARGWGESTRLTHVYHMGCYASLPALRIASGYLAASTAERYRCDLVNTEMCSLHLNPARHDPEQLVVQSLFSDGFIRYSLGRGDGVPKRGFRVLGFAERLVPNSLEDIGWVPGDFGMRMSLSRNVPDKVAPVLEGFVAELARSCGLEPEALRDAVYAVHPGGPRILDKVEEWLKLAPGRMRASREILFERGNMSSATLPHIWDRILADTSIPGGTRVVSLAFGPGLTLYGAILERT